MKENFIRKSYSKRIQEAKNIKRADKKIKGAGIIDFRSEQPDAMADFFVVDALSREAAKWENRGYGSGEGQSFNSAAAKYLEESFRVKGIDAEEEISVTNGSSSGMNMLALAFINRGDTALIAKPSVTAIENMTLWLGGGIIPMPLEAKNKFYPKYEDIPQKSLLKTKLMYISYPNNPTGQTATEDFFKETIRFAKKNEIIVIHDAAFAPLAYGEDRKLSFLSVPGAKKVGAELHSLSHGFNMAGWKIGFLAGNKNIIKGLRSIMDKGRFGHYAPMQQAAAYALSRTDISQSNAEKYERRMDLLIAELVEMGFRAKKPKAGFFIYVKAPKGVEKGRSFDTAYDFQSFLLEHGIAAAAFEDGYIRFSVAYSVFDEREEKDLMQEFGHRLKDYIFIF